MKIEIDTSNIISGMEREESIEFIKEIDDFWESWDFTFDAMEVFLEMIDEQWDGLSDFDKNMFKYTMEKCGFFVTRVNKDEDIIDMDEKDALKTILEIDKFQDDWRFTHDVIVELLDLFMSEKYLSNYDKGLLWDIKKKLNSVEEPIQN